MTAALEVLVITMLVRSLFLKSYVLETPRSTNNGVTVMVYDLLQFLLLILQALTLWETQRQSCLLDHALAIARLRCMLSQCASVLAYPTNLPSSANSRTDDDSSTPGISLIKTLSNKVPSTDPWTTPDKTGVEGDDAVYSLHNKVADTQNVLGALAKQIFLLMFSFNSC